jgi:hypothetical protein
MKFLSTFVLIVLYAFLVTVCVTFGLLITEKIALNTSTIIPIPLIVRT